MFSRFFILALLVALVGCGSWTADNYMEAATKDREAKRFPSALENMNMALESATTDDQRNLMYGIRAIVLLDQKPMDEAKALLALRDADKAIACAKSRTLGHLVRTLALVQLWKVPEAEEEARKGLQSATEQDDALLGNRLHGTRALILLILGRDPESLRELSEADRVPSARSGALDAFPTSISHLILEMAAHRKADYPQAVAEYAQALEATPKGDDVSSTW